MFLEGKIILAPLLMAWRRIVLLLAMNRNLSNACSAIAKAQGQSSKSSAVAHPGVEPEDCSHPLNRQVNRGNQFGTGTFCLLCGTRTSWTMWPDGPHKGGRQKAPPTTADKKAPQENHDEPTISRHPNQKDQKRDKDRSSTKPTAKSAASSSQNPVQPDMQMIGIFLKAS